MLRLSHRDRRAIAWALGLLIPAVAYRFAASPYLEALSAAREQVATQRDLLARELTILEEAPEYPQVTRSAVAALRDEQLRLFTGPDPLSAAAGLVNYLGLAADAHRVLIQSAETRAPDPASGGVVVLELALRGMADLEGLLGFLHAVEDGDKLVRIEQITIRSSNQGQRGQRASDEEVLTFAATVHSYAMAGPTAVPVAAARAGVGR